jgi:tetratricopeptide (TPR) repeat protein
VFDPVDATKHLRNTLEPLMAGDEDAARNELRLALCQQPDDETAKSLLWQLDAVAEDVLGREFFCYTVAEGDSLPRIAKEFLGDPYKFYLLAKFNDLEQPGRLRVGQCLKVPGRPPSGTPNEAQRFYRCGTEALAAGEAARAYGFFVEASRLDPTLVQAKQSVRETEQAVLWAHHKEAVAAFRSQRLGQAIGICRKALEIDPDNAPTKALLQEAQGLQGRLAALFLDEAVLALGRDDRAEAVANCDKVLELDPTHEKARQLRAVALGR